MDIGVRLSGALQTAHDAGVLHRDLKPANILIDQYGAPRLGNFGQARLADAEQTRTGEMAITPNYTAPEIVNGAPSTVQSDVYALAATVMTLLLGHIALGSGNALRVSTAFTSRQALDAGPGTRGLPKPANSGQQRQTGARDRRRN